MERMQRDELAVRRAAAAGLIVERGEGQTFPGEGGEARHDRLAFHHEPEGESAERLRADHDHVFPAGGSEERRALAAAVLAQKGEDLLALGPADGPGPGLEREPDADRP